MLVMTRKRDESILVDRNIEITVVEIRGDKVRLGVSAPKEVPVHRREVYESIHGIADGFADSPRAAAASNADARVAEQPALVAVESEQLALLDRLCRAVRDERGATPRREEALGAILAALGEAQDAIDRPLTLEHLQASIAAALRGSASG
jgi:carbon storage regulator